MFTEGAHQYGMFDGDANTAGRREARMKKSGAREQYTDKVGQASSSRKQGGAAGEVTGKVGHTKQDIAQMASSLSESQNSELFSHQVKASRHAYEISVSCQMPIQDMSVDPARRQVVWHSEGGSHAVTVPEGFEVEKASIVNDDLENGLCRVAVPVQARSVFS